MLDTNYIRAVLFYIEQHLTADLNSEHIAKRYQVSLSRLYQDFYAYTDHSFNEYIRLRRISDACERIKSSKLPIPVIASESGCPTEQTFQRQFKRIIGVPPLKYRYGDTHFYFPPFAANDISVAIKVSAETLPRYKTTLFYDSCAAGIEDKAVVSLGKVAGRLFGCHGKPFGGKSCYKLMTEISGTGNSDLYAACVVNYNGAKIDAGWHYLCNIWLPSSIFEASGKPLFEEYLFQDGLLQKLKLYLPVRKKSTN